MLDQECFALSLESYKAAFAKMFEVSRFLDISGSGHTVLKPMMGEVRAANCDFAKFLEHATGVYARHRELFDFSQPKPIDSGYHEWRGYFFEAQFIVQVPYDVWQYRFAEVNCDGTRREARREPNRYFLILEGPTRNFGVRDWEKQREERESLAEYASDEVRAEYQKGLEAADREVAKWLQAINSRPRVSLETSQRKEVPCN